MYRLQVIGIILLIVFVTGTIYAKSIAVQNFESCSVYKIKGTLSSDLKREPSMSFFSSQGLPLEIQLYFKNDDVAMKALGFKGKKIIADILVNSKLGSRIYTGTVLSLSLSAPKGLYSKLNDEIPLLLRKEPSLCKK